VKWILAAAVAVALAVAGYAWHRGGRDSAAGRFEYVHVGPRRHLLIPGRPGSPLLVLLHGRGMSVREAAFPELFDALDRLGRGAPTVLIVDGGDHSYYHDRSDFPWGSATLKLIRSAPARFGTNPRKVAVGGFSMGGFGALDLARSHRFCAVGGHSPALWRSGGETPAGAFDNAEDFQRHDVIGAATRGVYGGASVWLDVGDRDPFLEASRELGRRLGVQVHVWPGEHGTRYWRDHVDEYLRFYAASLARC
jgi:S-formylglutathione hydrolase FrmB